MTNFKPDFAVAKSASVADLLVGCANNERADWVSHEFGHDELILFQDGLLSKYIAKESIHCFVSGQFIATVLLSFSLIERSIAGRLLAIGHTEARDERDFEKLLKQVCVRKWISQEESDFIIKICSKLRNSLAHVRIQTESERHEVRALDADIELCDVIEMDAYFVLKAAFNILRKTAI
jgi:hypothetical protein